MFTLVFPAGDWYQNSHHVTDQLFVLKTTPMNSLNFTVRFLFHNIYDMYNILADLGGARYMQPPLDQNFFIFMQFWGKIGQIVC